MAGGGGGVCGRGACMAVGGMHGREVCMAGGHVWLGHAWQGACVVGGMHGRGAYMAGGCMHGRGLCMAHMPPPQHYEIWSVNAWVARILLECILVFK